MTKNDATAETIVTTIFGNDYKTIYMGYAIDVLNKQFVYKTDIDRLKREITAALNDANIEGGDK